MFFTLIKTPSRYHFGKDQIEIITPLADPSSFLSYLINALYKDEIYNFLQVMLPYLLKIEAKLNFIFPKLDLCFIIITRMNDVMNNS